MATVPNNGFILYDSTGTPIGVSARPLIVSQYSADGSEGTTINGVDFISGKSGVDSVTETLQTIEYDHHEIHNGNAYCNHFWVDVPADDVLDLRLVTPNTTKWIHLTRAFSAEAEFHVTLYETISITVAGTSMTARNQNRNSSNTTGLTAFDYIVNTSVGNANNDTDITGATAIQKWIIGSGRSVGGETAARDEVILKQNTGYSFRFENQSNAIKWIQWDLCWYEHTNKN
jgi:hypothetical protein